MKLKKVLFIDDSKEIFGYIETITRKIKSKGYELQADILNPTDLKFQVLNHSSGKLEASFPKIKDELTQAHFSQRYDVVACDFCFSNEELNGYDVIKWLINESNGKRATIRKSLFVSYSGEEDKFTNNIIKNHELIKLVKLKIHSFFTRTSLSNELSKLLTKEDEVLNLSNLIRDELEKHSDHHFKSIYPKFEGKSLGEVAREVESDSIHGIAFQKYMVELTVAHILDLNLVNQ
jgi:uncharacterized membrane protein YheB (UPF0754 family)